MLPLPKNPTSVDLARVANQFIAIGEARAVEQLKRLGDASGSDLLFESDMREQIGWLCRLIFVPTRSRPNRAPLFGGLSLPWNTMKSADWPFYPLAESKGIFFVLSRGYMLAGVPEDPRHYLDYCQANGRFRSKALKIPTAAQSAEALRALVASQAWLKIEWNDAHWNEGGGGFSYEFRETDTVEYLRAQTKEPY